MLKVSNVLSLCFPVRFAQFFEIRKNKETRSFAGEYCKYETALYTWKPAAAYYNVL